MGVCMDGWLHGWCCVLSYFSSPQFVTMFIVLIVHNMFARFSKQPDPCEVLSNGCLIAKPCSNQLCQLIICILKSFSPVCTKCFTVYWLNHTKVHILELLPFVQFLPDYHCLLDFENSLYYSTCGQYIFNKFSNQLDSLCLELNHFNSLNFAKLELSAVCAVCLHSVLWMPYHLLHCDKYDS